MRRIVKFAIIGALLSVVGRGVVKEDLADERSKPITRENILSSDMMFGEIEDKGVIKYIADNIKSCTSSANGNTADIEANNWAGRFKKARNKLADKIILIDQSGSSMLVEEDMPQYTEIIERQRALESITVVKEWTEDDLFAYIKDYKQRGALATQALEKKLKDEIKCEYDLRFDYVFVNGNSIYLTMLWDNGMETDMAVNISEWVAFAKSLTDYI